MCNYQTLECLLALWKHMFAFLAKCTALSSTVPSSDEGRKRSRVHSDS